MNRIDLFDLDFTLWNSKSKLAVINKDEPEHVLMRLNPMDLSMMKTHYKEFNMCVNYNGEKYYLNKEILDNIQKIQTMTIDKIGICHRDYTEEENNITYSVNVDYLLDNIKPIRKDNSTIALVTTNSSDNFLDIYIDKFKTILNKTITRTHRLNIIDDNEDVLISRKSKLIIEYLVGYHIKNNRFIDIDQTKFNEVFYFNSCDKTTDFINNLQYLFETVLSRSSLDIKREIVKRFSDSSLYYTTFKIVSNKLSPFIKHKYELKLPINLNIL